MVGMVWDARHYQQRFDRLAGEGRDVHGEADLVATLSPASVLDAGCGTGRVAIELSRRGVDVVGVDRSHDMLRIAHERAPRVPWVLADLTALALARRFDVVVLAGNVPLFADPGTQGALVAGCARHVGRGGALVVGFQLGRGYELAAFDGHVAAAGLDLEQRYATWARDPATGPLGYAVSVHRRPPV